MNPWQGRRSAPGAAPVLRPHGQQAHEAKADEQGGELEGHAGAVPQLLGDHLHEGNIQKGACGGAGVCVWGG